jgi:hypothetical protein
MKLAKLNISAITILGIVLLSARHLQGQTNIIISDPFTGSAGILLNGTAPQDHGGTGSDPWIQPANDMTLTGTNVSCANGINENAFLPFTPSAGNIYVLSADLNPFASGGDWLAIGFSQNANDGQWHNAGNSASGWILARGSGSGQTGQTFLGPETGGGAAIGTYEGLHTYSVVLDTTLVNWTFQYFIDGVSVRGPVAYSGTVGVNPTINYVGFGHLGGVLCTVDNFSIKTIPQTKISDPFTGGAGTILNGTAPQDHGGTGADPWIQPANDMTLTGTNVSCANGINENAFLPFTPANGSKYLLSADLNPFASGGDWFAIGFSQNANDGQWHNAGNNASGWILARGSGSGQTGQTFVGPETGGGGAIDSYEGLHTYSVLLDTTLVNWTFQYFIDDVSVRGPVAYSGTVGVNPTINYVGFGHLRDVLGTVDNFKVQTIYQSSDVGPSVAKQPIDATVVIGGSAILSASVAGTQPLSFQWVKISGTATNTLAGETNTILNLTNLILADDGSKYALVITNLYGRTTSRSATLNVLNVTGPLVHKFNFNDGTVNDSIGGITGTTKNGASVISGQLYLNNVGSVGREHAVLGPYVVPPKNATIVAWFNTASGLSFRSRVFDFGSDITSYWYFSPSGAGGQAQAGLLTEGAPEATITGGVSLADGLDHKIAVVVDSTPTGTGTDGTMLLYIDDALAGTVDLNGTSLAKLDSGPQNFFGLSQDITDPSFAPPFQGTIDEVRVYNTALSLAAIAALTPDANPTNPPVVVNQPQTAVAFIGGTADLSVTALGPQPFSYQWRFNGSPIAGANTDVYQITGVQSSNFGDYTVVITNNYGAVTSAVAQLSLSYWSYAAWNDDASSGIDSSYNYTHAYNFSGTATGTTINGVTFTGIEGVNPSVANVFTVTGEPSTTTDPGNNVTASSQVIATDFIYDGNPGTLTLNGLTPGRDYLLTLFSVGWEDGNRRIRFSGNNGQQLVINQDAFGNDNGIVVNYQYTASPSGSVTVTNAQTAASTSFHLYGFANRELPQPPSIQIVRTGSSSVTLSWPGSVVGYTLQSSPVLGAGASWQTASGVQLVGGFYQIAVSATGTQFYRLQK